MVERGLGACQTTMSVQPLLGTVGVVIVISSALIH